MKIFFLSFYSLILVSCKVNHNSTLELNFTSRNNDTLSELKSFSLNTIDVKRIQDVKTQSFQNIKCETPNKFILKNIKTGIYFGLMQIENAYGSYNISFDSITIKPGKNYLTKEINLGSVQL